MMAESSANIAQLFPRPSEGEVEVVAGGDEGGVGVVAMAALEVVVLETTF